MSSLSRLRCAGDPRACRCAASAGKRSVRPALLEGLYPFTLRPPPFRHSFAQNLSKARAVNVLHQCPFAQRSKPTPFAQNLSKGRACTVLHQGPSAQRCKPNPVRPEPARAVPSTRPAPGSVRSALQSYPVRPEPVEGPCRNSRGEYTMRLEPIDGSMAAFAIHTYPPDSLKPLNTDCTQ